MLSHRIFLSFLDLPLSVNLAHPLLLVDVSVLDEPPKELKELESDSLSEPSLSLSFRMFDFEKDLASFIVVW